MGVSTTAGPPGPVVVAAVAHVALDRLLRRNVAAETQPVAYAPAMAIPHAVHGANSARSGTGGPVGPGAVVGTGVGVAERALVVRLARAGVHAHPSRSCTTA